MKRAILTLLAACILVMMLPLHADCQDIGDDPVVFDPSSFLKRDLFKGVFIGGQFKDVGNRLDLKQFSFKAGYIIKVSDKVLAAVDMNYDSEYGIAGFEISALIPLKERILLIGDFEVYNFAFTPQGLVDNNTSAIKPGFVILLDKDAVWRNAWLALSVQFVYRSALDFGGELIDKPIEVPKENFENGIYAGLYLYFH